MNKKLCYFDIDGVLNTTPARGNLGFGVDKEKVERLMRLLPLAEMVCISYWRQERIRHEVILPFEFTFAASVDKRFCVPNATVIIDDQPHLYNANQPVFWINGKIGLTDNDVQAIAHLLSI